MTGTLNNAEITSRWRRFRSGASSEAASLASASTLREPDVEVGGSDAL